MNFVFYFLALLVWQAFGMDAPLQAPSAQKTRTRAHKRARNTSAASVLSQDDVRNYVPSASTPAAVLDHLQEEKLPEVFTPTSVKVRSCLIKSMVEAAYGADHAAQKMHALTADASLMCASPKSFARICNQKMRQMVAKDFEKKGISPQDFFNHLERARVRISEFDPETARLPAASRSVRALGKRLVSEIDDCPHVSFRRDTESGEIAYASGDKVGLDENQIKADQMSELGLSWLLAHEIQHIIHQDQLLLDAYEITAHSKKSQKKDFKQLLMMLSRVHEIFADVTPALRDKKLAQGYLECLTKWYKDDPDGGGVEHPKYGERVDLAEKSIAFLDQAEREKERTARRNLMPEFDKLAPNKPELRPKRLYKKPFLGDT